MQNPPGKSANQKMLENIRALRQQGAPRERIYREIERWRPEVEAENAEERKLSGIEKVGAVGSKMGAGVTFGLLDEAVGLFDEDAKNEQRFLQKQLEEENPKTAFAAEVAGSIAMPGSIFKAAPKAAGFVRKAGTVLAEGAAQGGLAGFGNAEGSLEQRLLSAGKGATLGSATAGAVGGVARGVARTAQRAGEGLGIAAPSLDDLVAKVPDDDVVTARANLARLKGRNLAHEATVADVLPQGEGALRQSAVAGGREVRKRVDADLRQRSNRLANEADDRFSDHTGTQRQSGRKTVEELEQEARAKARPHYEAAEQEAAAFELDPTAPFPGAAQGKADVVERLKAATELPYVRKALDRFKSGPRSKYAGTADDDPRLLDQVYKKIGTDIRELKKIHGRTPDQSDLLDDLISQRAELADAIIARSPSYRKALDEFAGPMVMKDAYELGATKNTPADIIPSEMKGLSAAEQKLFREGKAQQLRRDVPNLDIGEFSRFQDVLAPVASREKAAVFKATFGDNAYKEYVTDLLEMAGLQRMKAGAGESTTIDKALEQLNAEPEAIVGMIRSALSGNPIEALTKPLGALDRLRHSKTAKTNADFLLRRGEPDVSRSLDEIVNMRSAAQKSPGRKRSGAGITARVVGASFGGN